MLFSKLIIRVVNLFIKQSHRNPDYGNIIFFRKGLEKMTATDFLPVTGVTYMPCMMGDRPAEWIIPNGCPEDKMVLYFHGGGYATGSIETHRKWISDLARKTGIRFLLFDYHLAPEHKFPQPIDDSKSVWEDVLKMGFKPENIGFAGDSAGGGLATAFMLYLRDSHQPLPKCAYLCCPWMDMTGVNSSWKENQNFDRMVPHAGLVIWAKNYLGEEEPTHPYASPYFAVLDGLPPLFIQAGEREALRDDSFLFTEKARKAGVSVTFQLWEGMTHCWQSFWRFLPAGRSANRQAGKFLQNMLSKGN